MPNRPKPIAAQAHTFIPVNGSAPPWALAADPLPLEPDEPELLEGDEDDWESDELLVEDEEPLELEPELDDDELGCELLVVLVNGSTYCWSPADVLVPAARTAAAPPKKTAERAIRHATLRRTRRTPPIEPGELGGCRRRRRTGPGPPCVSCSAGRVDETPGGGRRGLEAEDAASRH